MLLIIGGPTASGKTYFAEKIAAKVQGEIISADSRTLYKDLRIGTGRYSNSDSIPYHLDGILEIGESYSAYDWVKRARKISEEIIDRKRIPLICGGTHHYIDLFINGIDSVPKPDVDLRSTLKGLALEKSRSHVHEILREIDPDLAEKVHPNNLERVVRYIERVKCIDMIEAIPPYREDFAFYCILPKMERIKINIETKIDEMLKLGWIKEVEGLMKKGYGSNTPGLDSIGYSDVLSHIEGRLTLTEARTNIVKSTLEYSKKQMKWMNRMSPKILRIEERMDLDNAVKEVLEIIDRNCRSHRYDS